MDVLFRTDDLPAGEGFAAMRENANRLPEAIDLSTDEPTTFHAEMHHLSLGAVTVSSLTTSRHASMGIIRTRTLIRRSDPEEYRFLYSRHGATGLSQGGRDAVLGPGDMGLYDTSIPHHGWRRGNSEAAQLLMVSIPHALLPAHPDDVRRATGMRLPGGTPIATLVGATVDRLIQDAHRYQPADAIRLSVAVVDLIGVLLASALGTDPTGWPAHHRSLLLRIQAHIEQRLDEPTLCPTEIAAAHHIGLRTLHRIFGEQGLTVAGWIRQRRLERCRRALVDPVSLGQPIYALAARYGFADGAHLTRTFRAAYGMSPQTYRRSWLTRTGEPTEAGCPIDPPWKSVV